MNSYRDLIVWQKSMALVAAIYQKSNSFPKEELYGLCSQLRRAAVSVPSNIAEGYGRGSTQDYLRFLQISRGSLYEVQTQIEIALVLHYLNEAQVNSLMEEALEIEKMLNSLIRKLQSK